MSYDDRSGGSFNSLTCRAVERAAKERKCRVRYAEPNELFVDIDSEDSREKHDALYRCFCNNRECSRVLLPSPSGRPGRYHAVVTLSRPVRDETERVMLQALLGSDSKRELLALLRIEAGCEPRAVSVLFERV